jgi:hypothetical protein
MLIPGCCFASLNHRLVVVSGVRRASRENGVERPAFQSKIGLLLHISVFLVYRSDPILMHLTPRSEKKWAASVAPYHGTPVHFHQPAAIFFTRRPISGNGKDRPSPETPANPLLYGIAASAAKMNLKDDPD